ncbi:hypothetical protein ACVWZW_005111 [Bradyrhizobium sp. F1.13.4]
MDAQAVDPVRGANTNGVKTISFSNKREIGDCESAIAAHGRNLVELAKPCTNSTARGPACKDTFSDLQPSALQAAE